MASYTSHVKESLRSHGCHLSDRVEETMKSGTVRLRTAFSWVNGVNDLVSFFPSLIGACSSGSTRFNRSFLRGRNGNPDQFRPSHLTTLFVPLPHPFAFGKD